MASPIIPGYTADRERVTGTIYHDMVEDVYYTPNIYTLTIHYLYADGTVAAVDYVGTYPYGTAYSVASPVISGYRASQTTVQGVMPASNVEITVYYTAIPATTPTTPELIVIDDYGTPLGLGNVAMNAGECIE